MTNETKKELLLYVIRVSNNMLVEALSQYGLINDEGRNLMSEAIRKLSDAEHAYRCTS